ncbi:CDP-glycerol glycerophosphotransferase family protein [Pseudomonas nitroreducens]|uniref:CDP-glycerol glycerophosphotransferase family protein n=1 Tax=Pseudomonas nitroreducens TaxID=46680 RepID=UPI002FE40F26
MQLHKVIGALKSVISALLSRSLAFPLTILVPRNPRLVVVIGREHGKYLDNAKHFFCRMQNHASQWRCVFLTESPAIHSLLHRNGGEVLLYPGLRACFTLLRAGTLVVDSMDYVEHGRVGLLRGAQVVQLWHGAPLKEIELGLYHRRLERLPHLLGGLVDIYKAIVGRYRRTNLLVSTSQFFTEHAFGGNFHADLILPLGYPRNDAMLEPTSCDNALVHCNVDSEAGARMRKHRESGGKVLAYMPTFRKDKASPFDAGYVDIKRLSALCECVGVLLVIKLHPLMQGCYNVELPECLIEVDPDSDFYPLLSSVDFLVTDYSSIYFDFLLLDRPIIFYPYDLDEYLRDDRGFLFEYRDMTPGACAQSFEELLISIEEHVLGSDDYVAQRHRVSRLVFDHLDANAAERLIDRLERADR